MQNKKTDLENKEFETGMRDNFSKQFCKVECQLAQ